LASIGNARKGSGRGETRVGYVSKARQVNGRGKNKLG
jgi:hypothetical protein